MAEGTDDSDFVTSLQLRNQQNSVNKGKEWSGFTYVSSSPSTGQFTVTRTNATGWEFTFATTAARAAEMDSILGRNSNFFIRVNASNDIVGKVDFAWRDGNNFGFRAKANATEQGDWRTGSATLWATGGLYPVLIDEGFLTGARLVEGNNVDLTTAADGRVTISATGSATGSIPYATQTQANDGNSSTTVISPETLHGVLDHTSHVASYPGFTLVSSSNDMPLGSVWINGTGTEARFRAHDVDESVSQTRQFLIDKSWHRGEGRRRPPRLRLHGRGVHRRQRLECGCRQMHDHIASVHAAVQPGPVGRSAHRPCHAQAEQGGAGERACGSHQGHRAGGRGSRAEGGRGGCSRRP